MRYFVLALTLFASAAFAGQDQDGNDAYDHTVGRVQGSLQCSFSDQNGKSFDCTLHVAGTGEVAISMQAVTDKKGNVVGYHGVDQVTEAGVNYTLAIGATANKAIKGISLITDNKDAGSAVFTATVAGVATGKTHAVNISPISIDVSDPHNIQISLSFVAYGDAHSSIITAQRRKDLTQYLVDHVQPLLTTLK